MFILLYTISQPSGGPSLNDASGKTPISLSPQPLFALFHNLCVWDFLCSKKTCLYKTEGVKLRFVMYSYRFHM